jgi:hypothetical protein
MTCCFFLKRLATVRREGGIAAEGVERREDVDEDFLDRLFHVCRVAQAAVHVAIHPPEVALVEEIKGRVVIATDPLDQFLVGERFPGDRIRSSHSESPQVQPAPPLP